MSGTGRWLVLSIKTEATDRRLCPVEIRLRFAFFVKNVSRPACVKQIISDLDLLLGSLLVICTSQGIDGNIRELSFCR